MHLQVTSLEDALVAELCPSEDGGELTSRTGLLLRRLEACAPAEEECTSANPLQVSTPIATAGRVLGMFYRLKPWTCKPAVQCIIAIW